MAKQVSKGPRTSSGSARPSEVAASKTFQETAKRMQQANTASPEIARSKLKDLGILASDGRLSDKYK